MRSAFSASGFLVVIAVLCILYFLFWNNDKSVQSFVNERKVIQEKQNNINSQIDDIKKAKDERLKRINDSLEQVY